MLLTKDTRQDWQGIRAQPKDTSPPLNAHHAHLLLTSKYQTTAVVCRLGYIGPWYTPNSQGATRNIPNR